eukprot:116824-Ditylum_brightwellii.AAC.1
MPVSVFAGAILDTDTGKALEYQDLIKIKKYRDVRKWSFTKELDQLAQGKCSHKGTNTVKCIACSAMPAG